MDLGGFLTFPAESCATRAPALCLLVFLFADCALDFITNTNHGQNKLVFLPGVAWHESQGLLSQHRGWIFLSKQQKANKIILCSNRWDVCSLNQREDPKTSVWKFCLEKSQKCASQFLWQLKSQKWSKERKGATHFLFFFLLYYF